MESEAPRPQDPLIAAEQTSSTLQSEPEGGGRASEETTPLQILAKADQQPATRDNSITANESDHDKRADSNHSEKSSSAQDWRLWANQNWILELLACVTSLLALVGIIILLRRYDGKPTPQWPKMITINSAIALLTIVVRGSIVFAVTEGISQLKWVWFRRPRPLMDLSAFDMASRGPWGSILFVFRKRTDLIALLGATVIIAAVAISPFAQQVIAYEPCYLPEGAMEARLPASLIFDSGQLSSDSPNAVDAIYYDMLFSKSDKTPTPDAFCPNQNCSFAQPDGWYMTLGMDHQCTDMSSSIFPWSGDSTFESRYVLRFGEERNQTLVLTGSEPNLMDVQAFGLNFDQNRTNALQVPNETYNAAPPYEPSRWPLKDGLFGFTALQYTKAFASEKSNISAIATTCQFYPTILTMNASIEFGVLHEQVVRSARLDPSNRTHHFWNTINSPKQVPLRPNPARPGTVRPQPISPRPDARKGVFFFHSQYAFYQKLLSRAVRNGQEIDCTPAQNPSPTRALAISSDHGIGPYPIRAEASLDLAYSRSFSYLALYGLRPQTWPSEALSRQRKDDNLTYLAPECYAHLGEAGTRELSHLSEQLFLPTNLLTAHNTSELSDWKETRDEISIGSIIDREKFGSGHLVPLLNNGSATFASVDAYAAVLAGSVTKYMRTYAGHSLANGTTKADVAGLTMATRTCARARWWWLAPPAVLIVLAFAFIIALARRSRVQARQPRWPGVLKSSPLPLLLYGTGDGEFERYDGVDDSLAMGRRAEGARTTLVRRRVGIDGEKEET